MVLQVPIGCTVVGIMVVAAVRIQVVAADQVGLLLPEVLTLTFKVAKEVEMVR